MQDSLYSDDQCWIFRLELICSAVHLWFLFELVTDWLANGWYWLVSLVVCLLALALANFLAHEAPTTRLTIRHAACLLLLVVLSPLAPVLFTIDHEFPFLHRLFQCVVKPLLF